VLIIIVVGFLLLGILIAASMARDTKPAQIAKYIPLDDAIRIALNDDADSPHKEKLRNSVNDALKEYTHHVKNSRIFNATNR
jgi:hypothetical protein